MYFVNYSGIEEHIFFRVKSYFDALPTFTADYKNGFYDVVAQFAGGGQSYTFVSSEYDRLITTQITEAMGQMGGEDKEELQEFYELHFLKNYYDHGNEEYFYSDDDLVQQVADRFKAWIDDNFNLEEMLEEEIDEEEEDAFPERESAEAVGLVERAIDILLRKAVDGKERRLLDLGRVYLSYHPLPPDKDYNLTIAYSGESLHYEIVYSANQISCSQYYTDEGSDFYEYKFILNLDGGKEEEGDWLFFVGNVETALRYAEIEKIGIYNEWL